MGDTVLALDCSGETYGCGLLVGKAQTSVQGLAPRTALRELPGHIGYLLEQAGVTYGAVKAVGVTVGPGSFTGVRLGVTLAKTIALTCGCGVAGFDTLEVLAAGLGEAFSHAGGQVAVALDARRGEVYGATFEVTGEGVVFLSPSGVKEPEVFAEAMASLSDLRGLIGSGFRAYPQLIPQGFTGPVLTDKAAISPKPDLLCALTRRALCEQRLGSAEELQPRYHREADIQVSGSKA